MASLWDGWDLLARAAVRSLVCSPNAFTFQWELTLVQVSNRVSSETVRAAKVLEDNQSVTGAGTSSGVLFYPRVTLTVGLMTSPRHISYCRTKEPMQSLPAP